jgi:hypothetical protein
MLLTLVLRRHLAKIHLCVDQEMNGEELDDDVVTIRCIAVTAWERFLYLKGELLDLEWKLAHQSYTRPPASRRGGRYEANL